MDGFFTGYITQGEVDVNDWQAYWIPAWDRSGVKDRLMRSDTESMVSLCRHQDSFCWPGSP